MIYFLYGADSYRSKKKLEEIIEGYQKVHRSGLNLVYVDAGTSSFGDFTNNFKISSMFAEKKLIILKNVFSNADFQEKFIENIKELEKSKDIVVIYEDSDADKRFKIFKELKKHAKSQNFENLSPLALRKWVGQEFFNKKAKISPRALDILINFVGSDLWRLAGEINKLSNYKSVIEKEDVELMIKPDIENDIFRTIDALASGNRKLALNLLHKHLEDGEAPLYLLSMIAFQFRNLLIIKESPRASGLHPFVVQKSLNLCRRFSLEQLKKIFFKIFQIDLDIKTGKIDPETALDMLISYL